MSPPVFRSVPIPFVLSAAYTHTDVWRAPSEAASVLRSASENYVSILLLRLLRWRMLTVCVVIGVDD